MAAPFFNVSSPFATKLSVPARIAVLHVDRQRPRRQGHRPAHRRRKGRRAVDLKRAAHADHRAGEARVSGIGPTCGVEAPGLRVR